MSKIKEAEKLVRKLEEEVKEGDEEVSELEEKVIEGKKKLELSKLEEEVRKEEKQLDYWKRKEDKLKEEEEEASLELTRVSRKRNIIDNLEVVKTPQSETGFKEFFERFDLDTTYNFDLDDVLFPWTKFQGSVLPNKALNNEKDPTTPPEIAKNGDGEVLAPVDFASELKKNIKVLIEFIKDIANKGYLINITSFNEIHTGKIYELLKLLGIKRDNIIVCNSNVCNYYIGEPEASFHGKKPHIILAYLLRNDVIKREQFEISGIDGINGIPASSLEKSSNSASNKSILKKEMENFSMDNQILFDDDEDNIKIHDGPCVRAILKHPYEYIYLSNGILGNDIAEVLINPPKEGTLLPGGDGARRTPVQSIRYEGRRRPPTHPPPTHPPSDEKPSSRFPELATPSGRKGQKLFDSTSPGTDSPGEPSRSVTKGPQKKLFGSPSSRLSSPGTPGVARKKTKKKKRKKTKKKKKKKSKGKKSKKR